MGLKKKSTKRFPYKSRVQKALNSSLFFGQVALTIFLTDNVFGWASKLYKLLALQ